MDLSSLSVISCASLELWRGDDEAVDEGEQHRLVLVVRDAVGAAELLDDDLEKNMERSAIWIHFLSCNINIMDQDYCVCTVVCGLPYMTSAMGGEGEGVPKTQTKGTRLHEFCI